MSYSVYEWGLAGQQESALLIFMSSNPLRSGSANIFGSSGFLRQFRKIRYFPVPRWLLGDWLPIGHQVVRKTVLCIVCFAYSLLPLILSLVVLVVVLVFPLLSY